MSENSDIPVATVASEAKPQRPLSAWITPTPITPSPQLHLYNSFTRKKELFVPLTANQVTWYICGPTVYDSSHMGHARAYLSFDILRRVLKDYFGYDIQYVMNITDIDDKIIKRARQQHLMESYRMGKFGDLSVTKVIKDVLSALELFGKKCNAEVDPDKRKMQTEVNQRVNSAAAKLKGALLNSNDEDVEKSKIALLNSAEDVISDWLDSVYGHTITDLGVFDRLSKKYEGEFLSDMAKLNILPPDVLTRVSEYIPEIIEYVQTIVRNGFGYITKDGSVYFDTLKFDSDANHTYAKLVPEAFADREQLLQNMRESEGELSLDNSQDKRNPSDFALWKSSKSGEPFWESPWGKGRPGWHIECSAMSSKICGSALDIHSGGADLKFPHHDNEIAQVEAYYNIKHWANYFLHCGTLRIAGLKMSKSLKNFITIRDALKQYTARQLRLLFLMYHWNDAVDYSASSMERAMQFEKVSNEFFLLVKDCIRRYFKSDCSESYQKFSTMDLQLMEDFFKIKLEIHSALCDSVDTRTVIEKLRALINSGNTYILEAEKDGRIPNCLLLKNIAEYMTWLLEVFGAIPHSKEIGFPADLNHEASSQFNSNTSKEEFLMPYLNALVNFREEVRKIARELKTTKILEECDRLRDEILPELGVRLEDRAAQTCVKLVDRETLLREQQQKKALEIAKEEERQMKQREKERKEAEKRVPPSEMFKDPTKYSAYDELGIPTHLVSGEEISKKQRKRLEKLYSAQQKVYEQVSAISVDGSAEDKT